MKTLRFAISTLSLMLMMTGCNTARFNLSESFDQSQIARGEAIAFGSFLVYNPRRDEIDFGRIRDYDVIQLKLRNLNTGKEEALVIGTTAVDDLNIDEEKIKGRNFIRRLPAGDYEIFSFLIWSQGALASYGYSPANESSVQFTIREGQLNYLGQIICVYEYSNDKGFFSISGGYFELSSNQEEDVEWFSGRYINLDWTKVNEVEFSSNYIGSDVNYSVKTSPLWIY